MRAPGSFWGEYQGGHLVTQLHINTATMLGFAAPPALTSLGSVLILLADEEDDG